MAVCALFKKSLREQFVATAKGLKHVRCSKAGRDYFCSLTDLPAYERLAQLDVASAIAAGSRCPALSTPETLCFAHVPFAQEREECWPALLTCRDRWPCTFFCWADCSAVRTEDTLKGKKIIGQSCYRELFLHTFLIRPLL